MSHALHFYDLDLFHFASWQQVVATGRGPYTSLQFCRVVSSSVTFKPPKHHEIPNPEALGIDGAETCAETSGN